MLPFPVVKHLDVLKAGRLYIGMGGVANAMHPFVLEAVEPVFSGRVSQQFPLRLIEQTMPYSLSLF